MRQCPACGNAYADDARFCPMDATLLPAADHALPFGFSPQALPEQAAPEPIQSTLQTDVSQRVVVASRFIIEPEFVDTPTGRLHRAVDLQAGAASLLLKLIPTSAFPSPMLLDRALRELRQLGRVASPRVMRVLATGKTPDGELYVAFAPPPDGAELLDEAVQRTGALPPDRARAVILEIGEALIEAHQAGVVHRNLAPHAVYLGPGDKVLVHDFALAEVNLSKGRMVQGSPYYLSPEQAEGKSIDQRSSVYNLGAIFYYLLTGAPPLQAGSLDELLSQVLTRAPVPASIRRPGLPPEVDHVLQKALDKASARRHLTLRQLLNELEELGSVAAPAPTQPVKPYRPASRTMSMETLSPPTAGDARFVQTLIGVAAPLPRGAVTPAALGAAFSAGPHAKDYGPVSMLATAVPEDESATVPMPRMSEEEMMATFGLSVPLRQQPEDLVPEHAVPAGLPIHQRPTVVVAAYNPPPMEQAPEATPAYDLPTLLGAETAVMPRTTLAPEEEPALSVDAPAGAAGDEPPAAAVPERRPPAFRETAWFKKGEIEGYLQNPTKSGEVLVSAEDHARLSLRKGESPKTQSQTQKQEASKVVPGEAMSDAEVLAEMRGGGRRAVLLLLLAAIGLLAGLAYVLLRP